jgi:hypothetical protein
MRRALLALFLIGCAPSRTDPTDGYGRADSALTEVGPLEPTQAVAAGSFAFRVEGYGSTSFSLDAPGAQLTVEGMTGAADHLDVTLGHGVYRVIVDATDPTTLTATCSAGCARDAISAQDLAAKLLASGQLDPLIDQLRGKLGILAPDPDLRAQLDAQLSQITAGADLSFLARFPTVPLKALGQLRPALGLVPASAPQPDAVVDGELADLLGTCDRPYAMPSVLPQLQGVAYGHFPNRALTACQAAHSVTLAQVLTSLAAQNGSRVSYRGQGYTTAEDLMAALVDAGHTVEVRNERTYANFLSFALVDEDTDSEWPVWIDTGVTLANGESLTVPMGHSGHAWRISGPDVNARVMFYLGISGAGFFAQTDTRPAWTGMTARDVDSERAHVVASVASAARYLRKNREERSTVAQGLPADGYGYLGVCNDSNAYVELETRGTITTFPLLRAASLPDLAPGLPHDADQAPPREDLLRRVLEMAPHPPGSPLYPDDELRNAMDAVAAELGAQ